MINTLTIKDYIDYEKLAQTGVGNLHLQAFLISRFLDLEMDHVMKIDMRLISVMINKVQEYMEMENNKISQEEANQEIKRVLGLEEDDMIHDRFGILDL